MPTLTLICNRIQLRVAPLSGRPVLMRLKSYCGCRLQPATLSLAAKITSNPKGYDAKAAELRPKLPTSARPAALISHGDGNAQDPPCLR